MKVGRRSVRIDGVKARYLLGGAGPALLLLASPLLLARTYLPTIRALSRWFTVIALELPGSGGSSRTRELWSFARLGAWTVEVVHRLPLAKPTVVGHSNAAPVAVEVALAAPRDVRGLVLVDPCGAPEPRSIARVAALRAVDALYEPLFTLRAAPALARSALVHCHTFWPTVRAACDVDLRERIGLVSVPTLLAWGDHDRTVPLASAERLRRSGTHLVVGPGAHDWLVTAPGAFAQSVVRFTPLG